jgi:hypothetical protein
METSCELLEKNEESRLEYNVNNNKIKKRKELG